MFEILCVTMNQSDFSKIDEMNVHSNIVFANQCDCTSFQEIKTDHDHYAKMISTQTRGVGINRNIASMYATADICLFSDDDVRYVDNVEEIICDEFETHPTADVLVFHFESDTADRLLKKYKKTHRVGRLSKKPWATFQIAFKRSEVLKHNINFTSLFGGGCIYPCGEDTQWIRTALKNGLSVYVSNKTIGSVSFKESTWFTGYDESYYYGQGAAYEAHCKRTKYIWWLYVAFRTMGKGDVPFIKKLQWMLNGEKGYKSLLSYNEYKDKLKKNTRIPY